MRPVNGSTPWAAACAFGLAIAAPAGAQPLVPVGGQFQVNTYTTSHQKTQAVATAPDGDFVVVWTS